jgi:hypothetical protein
MVTGHTVFRGSSAEIMYQHQHAPLPLERLKDVPQPVVVFLEEDPGCRFQNLAELLNAVPAITAAIDARSRIGRRSLQKMFYAIDSSVHQRALRPLKRLLPVPAIQALAEAQETVFPEDIGMSGFLVRKHHTSGDVLAVFFDSP